MMRRAMRERREERLKQQNLHRPGVLRMLTGASSVKVRLNRACLYHPTLANKRATELLVNRGSPKICKFMIWFFFFFIFLYLIVLECFLLNTFGLLLRRSSCEDFWRQSYVFSFSPRFKVWSSGCSANSFSLLSEGVQIFGCKHMCDGFLLSDFLWNTIIPPVNEYLNLI